MRKLNHTDFLSTMVSKSIDYVFVSSSFEERCFTIANIIKYLNFKSFIFCNTNEYTEVVNNADELKRMLNGDIISLTTTQPVENYQILFNLMKELEPKANILIDTTTFTHETLLVILKLCEFFKNELGNILVAYVGAKEYSINIKEDEDKWLSKGISEIRTVIGYPGITDPTKKNHLLVLFGFESERTKKLIDEYEYDCITLGFGDQPIEENHLKINYERHHELVHEYKHAKDFQFCLTDPIKACLQIKQYLASPNFADMNTVIAPLNNKLSTIGAGLAAIQDENIQIAYAKPNIYNIDGYSIPNEDIYCFELNFNEITSNLY